MLNYADILGFFPSLKTKSFHVSHKGLFLSSCLSGGTEGHMKPQTCTEHKGIPNIQ